RAPALARQDDIVATALERLAEDLLRLSGGVDVGGVHEVDPSVDRAVDDADAVVVVGVAPGAEHHRAEAELRDLDAGASERAVVHGGQASGMSRPKASSVTSSGSGPPRRPVSRASMAAISPA